MELFTECGIVIEPIFSSSTVASTREYEYPTNAVGIKRIEYNGKKLFPITMRDDDTLTLQNEVTTDTGEPVYYSIFNETLYLRPIPDSVGTLKVFAHCEPQAVTSSSTLEVPTFTHTALVDFVIAEMAAKDLNFNMAQYYMDKWQNIHIPRFKKRLKIAKRADANAQVQVEEMYAWGSVGAQ